MSLSVWMRVALLLFVYVVKKYNICTVIEYGAVILFLIAKFSSSVSRAMAKADSRHACLLGYPGFTSCQTVLDMLWAE